MAASKRATETKLSFNPQKSRQPSQSAAIPSPSYSPVGLIISSCGIDVTVTLAPDSKPSCCNQSPQSLISGTSRWLYLLNLVLGWIFRLRTSGRLRVVLRLSFRIILIGLKLGLAVLRNDKRSLRIRDFHPLSTRLYLEFLLLLCCT